MAGDPLIQEYTEGGHSAINGTKVKIVNPAGKIVYGAYRAIDEGQDY